MKLIPSFLLLAQAAVSLDPVHSDLSLSYDWMRDQDIPINDVKPADTREEGISKVMEILKANLTVAIDQAMIKLNSILLLKGHDQVSHGLFYKINQFKGVLCEHLKNDLSQELNQYISNNGNLPDSFEFSEIVLKKWEETLALQVEYFQESILPDWVHSVHGVWKGVEKKVLTNIKSFKSALLKSCSLPKAFAKKKSPVITAPGNVLYSKKSPLVIIGELAIVTLAITGVIALALASPFWIAFIALWMFNDHLAYSIFGPN